ncbi:MAG: alpha/beta fold hydrolase [Cyanobacteriota bacterium]|nr:alpha/beta fold hydrolase [Cyanobacteriota bacterium]
MSIEKRVIEVGSFSWFYLQAKPEKPADYPPVVFLHGIPSLSHSWSAILPELTSQGFWAVAPDWIGHGRSSKPDKRDFAYTPDAFIEALDAFLAALEIDRFSLVVQGFLGSVGLQYAFRNDDRIERLAILNTPLSTQAKLPFKMQQMAWPFVGDMMTQDPLLVDRLLEGGSRFVVPDEDLNVYRSPYLTTSDSGRSLMMTLKNLQIPSAMGEIEAGLSGWKQPTQILWGILDPWLSLEEAKTAAKAIADVEFVELPEAAHYPQEHWSNEISESLLTFLRRR